MPELHTDDIDGIRTFWVDTGRPTLAATLMFRHGQADEHFTSSGWTHLLEHLCLHGRGGGPLAINGGVGLLTTELTAHGPVEEVAEHLRSVCAWLAEPDLAALEHERGILAAESALRGQGDMPQALAWRYGARGPGLCAYQEPGLGRATPDALRTLAARAFGRGNAVLMLDGPPPAGLTLPLVEGEAQPFPPAVPCDDTRPASYGIPQGVVMSGNVARSTAATFLTRWLDVELRETLRHRAGAAYATWSHYEPADANSAVVLGGSDIARDHVPAVATTVLDLVDRLEDGCEPDRLATIVAEFVQGVTDPYQGYGVALRAGHYVLRGDEPETLEQTVDAARAVTPKQIATHARELAASLMVGLPPHAEASGRLPPLERPPVPRSRGGRSFRSANFPADASVLRVTPEAVYVADDSTAVGARLDRLVGLLQVPDGARQLVDQDGWHIAVEPTLWKRGKKAVERIDSLVPPHLHLPQPARDKDHIPKPAPVWRRHWHFVRPLVVRIAVVVAILAVVSLLVHVTDSAVPVLGPLLWLLYLGRRDLVAKRKSG